MLDFPSYSSVSWIGVAIAIVGAGAFLQNFFLTSSKSDRESFNSILTLIFGPIFVIVGFLVVISTAHTIYYFRQLPVEKVTGIEITRMADESNSQGARSRSFKDAQSVQDALKLLRKCHQTYRNHQSYQDGYAFTILFENNGVAEDYRFSAFRLTNGQANIKTVVLIAGNEFSCPTFQQWIKDNIDPLFPSSN